MKKIFIFTNNQAFGIVIYCERGNPPPTKERKFGEDLVTTSTVANTNENYPYEIKLTIGGRDFNGDKGEFRIREAADSYDKRYEYLFSDNTAVIL